MARFNTEILGDVFYREFDEGIITTLQGERIGNRYYLPQVVVPTVSPPLFSEFTGTVSDKGQPMPGIPFSMGEPSEVVRQLIPCIHIKREDPSPALERQHGYRVKYRAPAPGASTVDIQYRGRTVTGYSAYQEQEDGIPTDLSYTIMCEANGKAAKNNAHILLKHCMKFFYPHGKVFVYDTEGRRRSYWVHTEGPSELTSIGDIRDRTIIYALTCRVMAEIDVRDPYTQKPVTSIQPSVHIKTEE